MKRIAIIGGGTSGLFTAVLLKKWCPEYDVVILERLERVGKKILSTGAGRCNFSNLNLSPNKYNNPLFASMVLKNLDCSFLLKELEELGLIAMNDQEGRIYPYSEQATSFLDVLRVNIKMRGIVEKNNFEVKKITKNKKSGTFIIEDTRKQMIEANYCVIATGGKASPILGSNGTGYNILKPFKVKITDTFPGLVGVLVDQAPIKGLTGQRIKAKVSLFDKKQKNTIWQESGEVLFKDDGLSGIVIMQMASQISRNMVHKNVISNVFELDLMPNMTNDDLVVLLLKRKSTLNNIECSEFLSGMFSRTLSFNLVKRSKLDLSQYVNDLADRDILRLVHTIKHYSLEFKGFYGFERAQVTVGGIDLSEVNEQTLEINKIPNVFAAGEVLNIDGECGGYNMHFALASAYTVARAIKEKCDEDE